MTARHSTTDIEMQRTRVSSGPQAVASYLAADRLNRRLARNAVSDSKVRPEVDLRTVPGAQRRQKLSNLGTVWFEPIEQFGALECGRV